MIINEFDTIIKQITNIELLLKELAKFIIDNRTNITLDYNKELEILKKSSLVNSPVVHLASMFRDFLLSNKNIIKLLDVTTFNKIPEVLTFTYLDVDVKQIQDINNSIYKSINVFPEFEDKILINISNILNKNKDITDILALQSKLVRNILVRSYYSTDNLWISSSFITLLTEIYSIIISYNLARIYNLSIQEQQLIGIIFGIFFTQKCHNKSTFNPIITNCTKLGPYITINSVVEQAKEVLDGERELTLDDVITIIVNIGPDRVKNLNRDILNRLCRNFHLNHIISLISIEYPPYWASSLLESLSGLNKTNMYHTLKKTNSIKLANELVKQLTPMVFKNVFK